MNTITISFENDRNRPMYDQLYKHIKSEIQTGKIPQGTRLPSKRKLSGYLKISQNTIQTSYDQLIEEGYIVSYERKGYFVNQIDHLQKLLIKPVETITESDGTQQVPEYDFSYHGVDRKYFPTALWRKLMKDVINEYDTELLQLGDFRGYHELRSSIAAYLHQSRGVNCNENQVIISSGTEILFQSLIQLFDPESFFGIEDPGYERLYQLFTGNRAKFKPIPIDRFGMNPQEVEKNNLNILCITPAHQFPSGEIMPINRRLNLLDWANQEQNRYLVEDDYDSEFKYSGKPIPALQGLDFNEKVIYMGSMSKSLAPTVRVSYMVLPPHLMKRYRKQLSYQLCPVPMMDQKLLSRFIHDGYFERHLNKMRNLYKRKRETLVRGLTELNRGIKIIGADAGLHLLLQIPNQMTEDQLVASAMKKGVKVYGISKYYYDKKAPDDHEPTILVGYAAIDETDIPKAVEMLYHAWFSN